MKPSRTLYYYRTRLGTVVATSLGGGLPGAGYRYTPYGEVELSVNETEATRSELGYTNTDGGKVVSARRYNGYTRALLGAAPFG